MSDSNKYSWKLPMTSRNPIEDHRQSSFLELFFDLCFVVAIAQVATATHHAFAENHITSGLIGFAMIFFSIWWAWMNFTWFASAYDNDDGPYRIATFIQITGALVIASGVKTAFENQNFDMIFYGYVVMRIGLVWLWIRAAVNDSERKVTAIRYAIGITIAMIGWGAMYITGNWSLWLWAIMIIVELSIPAWAEKYKNTLWHSEHIAERYGLFFIIVLGESVLSSSNGLQFAIEQHANFSQLIGVIVGGLLILFSIWWLYFYKLAHQILKKSITSFTWGYGHYFIFAAVTLVGVGLAVNFEHVTHHTKISDTIAAATVAIPVTIFLLLFWVIIVRNLAKGKLFLWFLGSAFLIIATIFTNYSILFTGIILVVLISLLTFLDTRKKEPV